MTAKLHLSDSIGCAFLFYFLCVQNLISFFRKIDVFEQVVSSLASNQTGHYLLIRSPCSSTSSVPGFFFEELKLKKIFIQFAFFILTLLLPVSHLTQNSPRFAIFHLYNQTRHYFIHFLLLLVFERSGHYKNFNNIELVKKQKIITQNLFSAIFV